MLEDGISMTAITSDFVLNQLHALIRAPFELLHDYCEDYDQAAMTSLMLPQMKGMRWYTFTRFVRNAISHNFCYEFGKGDRKLLPVSWNGITLSEEMNGQVIEDAVGVRLTTLPLSAEAVYRALREAQGAPLEE